MQTIKFNSLQKVTHYLPKTYIYIVIHRQTVSFYQNSSVWLDTQDAWCRDRNPSNFTLDCDSDHSSTKRTMLVQGIFLKLFSFLETAAAAFVSFFYTLSATRPIEKLNTLSFGYSVFMNLFQLLLNRNSFFRYPSHITFMWWLTKESAFLKELADKINL